MLLSIITLLTIVACYSAHLLPRNNEDFTDLQKQKAEPSSNNFLFKRNLSSLKRNVSNTTNTTSTHTRQPGKWQVERITRRQYEIINLLWRKTKIFVNVDTTPDPRTTKHGNLTRKIFDNIQGENTIILTVRPLVSQSFTPSNIEFYYYNESGDDDEKKDCVNSNCQLKNSEKLNSNIISRPNSSFLMFHIKSPLARTASTRNYYSTLQSPPNTPRYSNKSMNRTLMDAHKTMPDTRTRLVLPIQEFNETKHFNNSTKVRNNEPKNSNFTVKKYQTESTTVYDKIKFFELYDKHTRIPFPKKANMLEFDYNENTDEVIEINNVNKVLLEHVDQSSHEHDEAKHSKKHISIIEKDKNWNQSCHHTIEENTKPTAYLLNATTKRQINTSLHVTNDSSIKADTKESENIYSYINKSVSWYKYPFAAVYIYEPSQVHCDAASISAHWLVASGSCLSRLNEIPALGNGRSAFVAYCGGTWWQPQRVSYVKYSVVHPRFHPRDQTRRNLYNIGVIQVVTSMMSACSEWAPVSLMSHQFAANQWGSEATALGWGLDRYDTRYAAVDLPRAPLMLYKGLVFSDSCPGYNIRNGKVKRFREGGGLKNVYCLSLPPYSGEHRDPIHGSLLLVGGKLLALYLQEERRPWGEQSAQYTGIWHLIPWVVEVAREPEELESFMDI